jgi:exonuclease SbcC
MANTVKLKRLVLEDFQAHESFKLDFSPSITSITGPSDRGKSAVLRAIRWICLNDISGNAFIRQGAKRARVKLLAGKHKIVRSRSETGNSYFLDSQRFKAFGSSVPDPIEKALPMSDLNFQGQHDGPFWFSKTAGEVSRQLNSIIDLKVIDTSLANVSRTTLNASQSLRVTQVRLKEKRELFAKLKPMQSRITEFKSLEEARKRYRKLKNGFENLDTLINQISIAQTRITFYQTPDITPLQETYDQLRKMECEESDLQQLLYQIEQKQIVLEERNERLQTAEKQLNSIKLCPTCGQPIYTGVKAAVTT